MARDLTNALLASPNQASTAFGVGGAHPIRQKSLFVMRFLRKAGEGGDEWKDGLSFLVKSIDRPTVQPVVEELNQYNKKRIIHTGVKYSPVTCVLYDTADAAAMNMWVQYAQYYIGDYRQDAGSYSDDIIAPRMFGENSGYGYGITTPTTSSIDGANTQFFFDRVDIFQVWGGEYTCFQLLNPKINNFDPDDLDYESSGANMITMGLTYEAIFHENDGRPQSISRNSVLVDLFGGIFNGETFDPEPTAPRTSSFVSTSTQAGSTLAPTAIRNLLNNTDSEVYTPSDRSDTTTSSGGALSKYGDFDFGNFVSLGNNLPTELSTVTGTSSIPHFETTKEANEYELARLQESQRRVNSDALGAALGSNISSIGNVAGGLNSAALMQGDSPLDHVRYDDDSFMADQENFEFGFARMAFVAPTLDGAETIIAPARNDATVTANRQTAKGGLSLSPLALATVNTASDGRSQMGQRINSQDNPLLSFIVEPVPSTDLLPDLAFGYTRAVIEIIANSYAEYLPRA